MTIDRYKEKFNYRMTISLERCQFCDHFVKPQKGGDIAVGGCKDMKKRIDMGFNETVLSYTCDNYANHDGKFV